VVEFLLGENEKYMNDIYLFECDVVNFGTDEVIETIHCLAYNLFQATHIFNDEVFGEDSKYVGVFEVGRVKKLSQVKNLINPFFALDMMDNERGDDSEDEFDGSYPIRVAKNLMTDEIMNFDCPKCHDEIKVPQGMLFPYVTCPTCSTKIWRKNIKNVGGIYIVDKNDET